jgi:hypothetical protein
MTPVRLTLVLIASCALISCGHNADLKYPSVAQADEMDVQWGLPKRKARGGPKQFFQSNSSAAAAAGYSNPESAAPAVQPPAAAAPAQAPAAAVPAQPSVSVPANLR